MYCVNKFTFALLSYNNEQCNQSSLAAERCQERFYNVSPIQAWVHETHFHINPELVFNKNTIIAQQSIIGFIGNCSFYRQFYLYFANRWFSQLNPMIFQENFLLSIKFAQHVRECVCDGGGRETHAHTPPLPYKPASGNILLPDTGNITGLWFFDHK